MEESHYNQRQQKSKQTMTRRTKQPEIIRRYTNMLGYVKTIHKDFSGKELSAITLELMKLERELEIKPATEDLPNDREADIKL